MAENKGFAMGRERGGRPRNLTLAAFAQASNVTTLPGSWRHPFADAGYLSLDYYIDLARTLDRGGVDLLFFDDRLAMPGVYGDSEREAVRCGARPVKLDPMLVLAGVAASTSRIGLAATCSTTYNAPYGLARSFATLDHLSGGRAAWNIVTSVNGNEASNFGVEAVDHDQRYEMADEFMEAVCALWSTWDDGALVADRRSGTFALPDLVRPADYSGRWHKASGPLTVPRSPQGRPLLIQAGQSESGRAFAARWADLVFANPHTFDASVAQRRDLHDRMDAHGRSADQVCFLPAMLPIVGETEAIAQAKVDVLTGLEDTMASLVLLSEFTDHDFAQHDIDEPISDELLASVGGSRGFLAGLTGRLHSELGRAPTVRDLAANRSTVANALTFVGTTDQVADQIAEWFESGACDGFAVMAGHSPGTYEDFVRAVVPELRRRGLCAAHDQPATLRDRLGIEVAQ
ncbi:MAG TPA: NtaA/DmoA family FMN-dependent monooxygenase [Ilumatobacter sp.]|nr:NtaA/DmoA family FMN-dependent monooxygenase [Ilumatobacter sp.]